jgi:hypothetical protein
MSTWRYETSNPPFLWNVGLLPLGNFVLQATLYSILREALVGNDANPEV